MGIWVIGVNHHRAPAMVRSQWAFSPTQQADFLQYFVTHIQPQFPDSGLYLLSTCNRSEIYGAHFPPQLIYDYLKKTRQLIAPSHHDFYFENQEAIRHLLRVASGLDSLVLGETQILGQVKNAFQLAQDHQTLNPIMHRALQTALSTAKQVRSETQIGANTVSVASTAARLLHEIFPDPAARTALLIGAGETCRLLGEHLRQQGVINFIVCNRNLDRAQQLSEHLNQRYSENNTVFSIEALQKDPKLLAKADILACATDAGHLLLNKTHFIQAIKLRRHEPILALDLSIPANFDPKVADMDDVYLYGIDDLQGLVSAGLSSRKQAALAAEALILKNIEEFLTWQTSLATQSWIAKLYEKTQSENTKILQRAEKQFAQTGLTLSTAQKQILAEMLHQSSQKILHSPAKALRQSPAFEQKEILCWAKKLHGTFGIS